MSNAVITTTQSESTNLMTVISRAASDPTIDVQKLEKLLEMYERVDARRAERAFSEAMEKVQSEIPQLFRDRENEHKRYRYTTLEELNKSIVPIYTKYGFGLSFGSAGGAPEGYYRITCHVSHRDGHSRDYEADLPTDMVGDKGTPNKTAIQGFGSTMSYGRRYLTLLIFNISTTDDDDGEGGRGGEKITAEQSAILQSYFDKYGWPIANFTKFLKVESLADIPASKFEYAKRALEAKVPHAAA